MKVTAESYREASLTHIDTARDLLEQRRYVLATYLAGLAIECMLRAYSHRIDSSFDARHDLLRWYTRSKFDAVVPVSSRSRISAALSVVVLQWNNSQRYYSPELLRAEWKAAGPDRGIKGDFVKECTRRLVVAALDIVEIGKQQWTNSSRKLPRS